MDFALPQLDTKALADTGVEVPILDLDGKTPVLNANDEPVSITVLGSDGATYRRATRAYQRALLDIRQKNAGKAMPDDELDKVDAAEFKLYAAVTVGWKGIIDSNGDPVPFTQENAAALYEKIPAVKEQAIAAVSDRARFIRPLSKG